MESHKVPRATEISVSIVQDVETLHPSWRRGEGCTLMCEHALHRPPFHGIETVSLFTMIER